MDIKEIRESNDAALVKRSAEVSEEIFRLRCVAERMTPQRGSEIRVLRREYARIQTCLRQRALPAEMDAELATIEAHLKSSKTAKPKLRARKRQIQRTSKEIAIAKGK